MKIALIGYGKMGHEVEKAAVELSHEIAIIIDNEDDWSAKADELKSCDVAIEFSAPSLAKRNIMRCFEMRIPVVVGTTGWYEHLPEITKACENSKATLFYASNFSIGVNIFFDINRRLASLLEAYPAYSPAMIEVHHLQKLDSPSGTAITLAHGIIDSNSNYSRYGAESAEDGCIPIESVREGTVTGKHTVTWSSDTDHISISHEAISRRGFATGAVMAASWVKDRTGIFTMKDMLNL